MGNKAQIIEERHTLPLYPEDDLLRKQVVIWGADDNHCKLPTAANQKPAGVNQEDITELSGLPANIARRGRLNLIGKGTGSPGEQVVIATSAGDVQTVATLNPADNDVINVVGELLETMVDGKTVAVDVLIYSYVHMEA